MKAGRAFFEPGEISLSAYLAFALLVRLPAVVFSRGYDFMDHQFQYVDPAYHLGLGGSWWRPHDYVEGLRSWVYPGFLGGLFRLMGVPGFESPEAMMVATRFVHALIGLAPWAALWMLLTRWKGLTGQRPLLLFAAGNGLSVYTNVQPTGPTFATGLSLTSIFLFEGPGLLWPLVSGLLLGAAFACRFQDAFFGPVLLAAGLLRRRYRETALMILGAAVVVTLQGLVDLATWGSFLASPFRYVRWNVFEGAAGRYGQEPFYYYALFLALVLVLVPPFLKSGARALVAGARQLPLPLAAAAFYLFLHTLVARKAFRFVLPALILLLVVYAFDLLQRRTWHRRVFLAFHCAALLFVSFWYPHRGPVEAALALSRRADFTDRLLIVDGDEDALGGHYYLRRRELAVSLVERGELHSWIAREQPKTPLYVLVAVQPLGAFAPPAPFELEPIGEFRNWPDLQRHGRRFLYRLRRISR